MDNFALTQSTFGVIFEGSEVFNNAFLERQSLSSPDDLRLSLSDRVGFLGSVLKFKNK